MEKIDFLFENSFINLNIDAEDVMVSSFPNKIVIGEPLLKGYTKAQSFYIYVHEIKDFYFGLCSAIEYITFEKAEKSGDMLKRSSQDVYTWEGIEIVHTNQNGESQHERKFKIQKNENNKEKYEVLFNFHQTEILIKIFNDLVLTSMCLKYSDRKLIEKFIDKKLCPNFDNKLHLVTVMVKENETENLGAKVDLMFHYREILQLLVITNDLRIKLIHPQFFIDGLNIVTSNSLTESRA